jgi:5-methylcytosine-specific restriction endonuclease McrA
LRKQVQDCNYKAFARGCKKDDENHISLKSWLEIKEKHGNRCVDCGIMESVEMKLTIDHIHPISKGGKNNKDNIAPRCFRCNSLKSDKIISIPHTSLK